jgi:2-polyprenyl-6-methoxyphenol hydroxylase-like FAD-dependent oxidoreductase
MPGRPRKVLITGAGIAGPALAYWLSRIPTSDPLSITILERSSVPRQTGQAIDIRGPAVEAIRRMGIEPAILEAKTPELGGHAISAAGNIIATFDATGDVNRQSIISEFEILRADLARICCEAAERPGVNIVYGDYVSTVTQDLARGTVHVQFTNGKLPAGDYDLVVGADSTSSRMRPFVTGRPAKEDQRSLDVYVAYFTIPRAAHDSSTHSKFFLAPGRRTVILRPSRAGTGVLLFSTGLNPVLASAASQDIAAQKSATADAFADIGFEASRIIEGMLASDDFYFESIAQVHAPRWHDGRVALVGDAAYASGQTGMGTSLALVGAYILAGELIQAFGTNGDGDVPAALDAYERRLRPYVHTIQEPPFWIRTNLFPPQTRLGVWCINTLMWLVSASGILKVLGFAWSAGEREPLQEYDWTD